MFSHEMRMDIHYDDMRMRLNQLPESFHVSDRFFFYSIGKNIHTDFLTPVAM